METYKIITSKFSTYKTSNEFLSVVDVRCDEDFYAAMQYAEEKSLPVYMLGNGSNTFFAKKKIETLILRNCLEPTILDIGNGCFSVSSSTKISKLLRYLLKHGYEGPYNLASVPATVGGAVAMNAGTGRIEGLYINKYIESVSYLEKGEVRTKLASDLDFGYRKSVFSEGQGKFIVSVAFKFPKREYEKNPIKERLEWAKKHQDLSLPSCGSVWREYDWRIALLASKLFVRGKAYFSRKSTIWITNESKHPIFIRMILFIVRFAHRLFFLKCEEEIRIVKK